MTRWHTPPQVAAMLGIDVHRVGNWIDTGALPAVNVSDGVLRPRWRISPEALEQFLLARQNGRQVEPVRRRKTVSVKEYF